MQAGAITVPPPEPSMLLDPTELLLALRLEPTIRINSPPLPAFRLSRGVPLAKLKVVTFNLHASMFENLFR